MKKTTVDFERLFGRIALVLISIILALIVADKVSIQFLRPKKFLLENQFSVRDIRRPQPYLMFKGAPFGKAWKIKYIKTGLGDRILNELGYPGEAPCMPKPANEYRVIVLGGSSVFMGYPALPRLIQYEFEKAGCPDVKVYNFAVVSSVSGMELARLVFEAVNYAPDLIISYSGFNDIDQPFVADPRPGYPYNFFIYEENPILESEIRDYPLAPLMAYSSNLARYFGHAYFLKKFIDLEELRQSCDYGSPQWRQAIVDTYVDNIVKSQKIAHAFGADFIAFLQPCLYFKTSATPREQKHLDPKRMSHAVQSREMIVRGMQKAAASQSLHFVDLSGLFSGHNETVFIDRVHIRYLYRPQVAKKIYHYLLRFLREENIDCHCLEPGISSPGEG